MSSDFNSRCTDTKVQPQTAAGKLLTPPETDQASLAEDVSRPPRAANKSLTNEQRGRSQEEPAPVGPSATVQTPQHQLSRPPRPQRSLSQTLVRSQGGESLTGQKSKMQTPKQLLIVLERT